jgi:hypothetical protein
MRVVFDIVLFLSLFIVPWWLSLSVALVGVFFFSRFYEIIIAGVVVDILYGVPQASFFGFQYISSIVTVLFFIGGEYIKKRMIFY